MGWTLTERDPATRQRVNIMWNTVQVPIGWKAWWLAPNKDHAGDPDFYQNHPNNCYADAPEGCVAWHNPEFRDTKGVTLGPSRIHSGKNSQKYFTFWSVHRGGRDADGGRAAGQHGALWRVDARVVDQSRWA